MPFKSNLTDLRPRRQQFSRRIKLLSSGYIKPESFPEGEITVFPWDSTIDEWLVTRLKAGNRDTVLFDLCAKVCDLNGCPLDSFLLGDVNTVLLIARAIRYANVIQYPAECRHCGFTTTQTIKVPDDLERIGEKDQSYTGWDAVTLPDCKDVVAIRPLQVRDEKAIAQRDDTIKALMTERIHRVLSAVVSINEGKPDCWEDVARWYLALSPNDSGELENKQNELYPHLNTEIIHRCDDCGKIFSFNLDLNDVEFFRSSLKSSHRRPVAATPGPGMERQGANSQRGGHPGPVDGPDGGVGEPEDKRGKPAT